jgi:hypothetical protein
VGNLGLAFWALVLCVDGGKAYLHFYSLLHHSVWMPHPRRSTTIVYVIFLTMDALFSLAGVAIVLYIFITPLGYKWIMSLSSDFETDLNNGKNLGLSPPDSQTVRQAQIEVIRNWLRLRKVFIAFLVIFLCVFESTPVKTQH